MSAMLASEEVLVIETPERVPLHFALASIGNRFLACAIDHAIQALALGLIAIASLTLASFSFIEQAMASAPKWVIAVMIILLFLVFAGYFTFFEWIWSGQTPGKRVMGARIVDAETGGPVSTKQAIIRYLGYYVSMLGLFIGYFWVGFDPKKQGWHDHMAGTVVVRKKASSTVTFAKG